MAQQDNVGNGNFAQSLIIDKFDKLEKAIEKLAEAMNNHQLHNQDEIHVMRSDLIDRINELQKAVTVLETRAEERGRNAGMVSGGIVSFIVGVLIWVVKANVG